jgi:hypothetical protein
VHLFDYRHGRRNKCGDLRIIYPDGFSERTELGDKVFAGPSLKTKPAINPLVIRVPFRGARRIKPSENEIKITILTLEKGTKVDAMVGSGAFGVFGAEVASDKLC